MNKCDLCGEPCKDNEEWCDECESGFSEWMEQNHPGELRRAFLPDVNFQAIDLHNFLECLKR